MEKKELTTNEYRNEIEFQISNARLNAESPYNDGWTQQGYREKVIYLEKKLKTIGKQLKFNFSCLHKTDIMEINSKIITIST